MCAAAFAEIDGLLLLDCANGCAGTPAFSCSDTSESCCIGTIGFFIFCLRA
jgi:hypothetical protein